MANIATITNNIISALSGTTSQVLLGNATLTDFKLDSLTDVSVPTPGDGDVLKWNSTTSLWEASDSAGITGSGAAGQVAYFTGSTTQAGSNSLFWDNANGRLGIGTNVPDFSLSVTGQISIGGVGANLGIIFSQALITAIPSSSVKSQIANLNSGFGYAAGSLLLQPRTGVSAALVFATEGTEKMRLTSGGNFIINNSASDSGQRLQVTGTALITGAVTFGTLALGTGLYWDNTNNRLGIGHSAPATQLHVRNQTGSIITLESTNAGFTATPVETSINFNGYGANLQAQISSQDKQANLAGGWLLFRVKDASNALQDRLIIDRSGFVGIGTTTPAYRLDVQTSGISTPFRLFQANYQSLTVDYPATFTTQINMGLLGRIEYDGNGGMMTISNRSTQAGTSSMGFVMGTTERIRITDTGNVGIGTTGPTAKMDVVGLTGTTLIRATAADTNGNAEVEIKSTGTTGVSRIYFSDTAALSGSINYNHSSDSMTFGTAAAIRATLDASGNLGIGTPSPLHPLDVTSAGNTILYIRGGTSTALSRLVFGTSANNNRGFIDYDNTSGARFMSFKTEETERMRITATNGNLHIGTFSSDSGEKLQVTGTAKITGATTFGSTMQIAGNGIKLNFFNSGYENWYLGTKVNTTQFVIGSATNSEILTFVNSGAATFSSSVTAASLISTGNATINGISVGRGAGASTTNTAVGLQSSNSTTTGVFNVSFGHQALFSNNTGSYNVAIGASSLYGNTSGQFNTAIGLQAGYGTASGTQNITGSNNIFIGKESVGENSSESNRTWIGNTSTFSTWVGGNLLIGTRTNSTYILDAVGNTRLTGTLLLTGAATLSNLAGTGTRIVVTDASGNLSTQPTQTYLSSLSGEATNSGSAVTLTNSAVIGKVLTGLNVYSAAIAATDSILAAFGKIQGQIDGLQGGTIYKGSWNANTNIPAITSGTGTQGNYYVVTTAGTTTIDGVSSWAIGDWIIFNGTIWEKIPNVDAITSVNGQTGVVSLTTANISEVTNLYYTDARARAAISLTTSGSSGASTYSSGVLNIPTYTLAGLGGVATGTTITINGTAQDLSASRTFNVGTVTSIVAGTYLTGGTITGSGTIAVDATTTNTASKIVARDSSGNFSAGIVTSIGVNSGNFYDGVGSYNVNLGSGGSEGRGLVAGYSGGAYGGIGYNVRHDSTVTYIAPLSDTSSYLSFTSGGFIFYGAPSGTVGRTLSYSTLGSFSAAGTFNAVNITVNGNQTLHAANWNSYAPSLTGTGASGSWGISVTGNAGTVGGLSVHTDRNNEVNKIVRTDANGYIQAGWINTTSGDNGTTAIDRIYASSDAYLRYYTPANFRTVLDVPTRTGGSASGTWGISVTGNAATATTATNQSGGTVNATTAIITPNVTGVSTGLSVVNGDITTYRSGGTTGVIYLSSSGTKYLYWDATNYNLPGGGLAVGGNISASNFSGSSSGTNTGDQTNISGNAATATNVAYSGLTGTVPTWNQNTTGNAATATSATNALRIVFNDGPRNLSDRLPNSFTRTVNFDFTAAGAVGGTGNYAGVMSFSPWIGDTASTGDSSYQLGFMNGSGVNGAGLPGLRIRKGIDTTWGDWYTLLHAGNYNSYSPTLTGTGASGTWGISISGNAATASTSSQVTINYNNNADASYQMLWGSGNSVYGTAGITCNPFTDTVNLTGTINSAGIGVVGFGRMYGGDFWHSGTANNGTRTPTLKLGRFSDAELPAYTIYTDDTSGDILEFLSERYTADFRLTRNSDTGVRNAVRMASDNNGSFIDLYNGGGSAVNSRITTTGDSYLMGGNVGIGISSPLYKLDVSGNVRFAGELLMTDTETSVSEGSQTARFQKTYSSSSNISNLNLYSTASVVVFDLTNSTYSGNETYNATALLAQAVIIGNSGTVSSQPMRAIMTGVVGQNGSATMNIADYRHFEVKQPDRANLTGHVIQNIYGLKIAPLKAASGYNITNGWGVYQEGVSDNNHFSGKVLIGTTSVGGSPLRLSGLPTSSAGLSAGDVWNSGGTLRIV